MQFWMRWVRGALTASMIDRKSTRLNSSHLGISYAVFCLKKKKKHKRLPATFHEAVGLVEVACVSDNDYRLVPAYRGDFFFFNDTATTEIYTLSLHDALPI